MASTEHVDVKLKDWPDGTAVKSSATLPAGNVSDDDDDNDVLPMMVHQAAPGRPSFCRRRGPHLAVAAIVVAALCGLTIAVFVRNTSSATFPIPKKFTATVAAYQKLPNGSITGDPIGSGTVYRQHDVLRALIDVSSAAGAQRHVFTAVDDQIAYQVYPSPSLFEGEEATADGTEEVEAVNCLQPGDAPSIEDVTTELGDATLVDEQAMIDAVGAGACAGDVTRFMGTVSGITVVICMRDSMHFEAVTQDMVAFVDATSAVDTTAMNAIVLPLSLAGEQMECPSMTGVATRYADEFAVTGRRRRLVSAYDCLENAANSPLLGDCAAVHDSLPNCQWTQETLYFFTGIYLYACVPATCSSGQLDLREDGFNILCLPLPGDNDDRRLSIDNRLGAPRDLGKKTKEDDQPTLSLNLRIDVPKAQRVKKCTSKKRVPVKRCVFVHGAGAPPPSNGVGSALTNTFPWYWGPVHHYVEDFCTEVKFVRLGTADSTWADPDLARHFCYRATTTPGRTLNDASYGDIEDTLLFVHGAGNLIVANAFDSGLCGLADSSHWFEVQDGDHLSRLAKWNHDFCDEVKNAPNAAWLDEQLGIAAAKLHEVQGDSAPRWPSSKKEKKQKMKEWREWRKEWAAQYTKGQWSQLVTRQKQRRLVQTLGVCKWLPTAPDDNTLSRFTFDQSPAWAALAQNGDADAFPAQMSAEEIKRLAVIINTQVSGSMCASLPDNARHEVIFHNVKPTVWKNEFDAYDTRWSRCWSPSQEGVFESNPRHHSYKALTSFYETTCRYGNPKGEGDNGVNRPCEWYRHMACSYGTRDADGYVDTPPSVIITDDDFESIHDASNDATSGNP